MINRLIALSLVVIPFYEVILYLLVPGRSMPEFQDLRITKDFLVMGVSLAVGLSVLHKEGFKPLKVIWPSAFIFFLVWNIFKAPRVDVSVSGANIGGIWNYLPFAQILCLFLLFLGIVNGFSKYRIVSTMKIMMYVGVLMSGYMILQKFGLDQIFQSSYDVTGRLFNPLATHSTYISGSIGNPTLSGPFVCMMIPVSYYFRNFLFMSVICVAVIFTESSFAILSMASVLFVIGLDFFKKSKKSVIVFILSCVVTSIIGLFVFHRFLPHFLAGGDRFYTWKTMITSSGAYMALTGMGIGSFKYLFGARLNNSFFHAHNEYLQLFWTCGIIGVFIAGMIVREFLKMIKKVYVLESRILALSLLPLFISSMGTFPFQLGVFQFYAVVIIGMIYLLTEGAVYGCK